MSNVSALRCDIFRERLRVSKAPLATLGAGAALTRAARSFFSRHLPERQWDSEGVKRSMR